jgi:imidazolonepropionase-like amidohydrolase
VALVHGTLIDGTGREPVLDAVVAVRGDRIVAVGPGSEVVLSPDTPTVDVESAAILPGLINAHVHEANDLEALEAWAQAGVTTVRDVGTNDPPAEFFAFRDSISDDPAYARLVATGPIVTAPGGYGMLSVASPEDARQTSGALLDAGADLIKIAIEDDLQGRRWPLLPRDEIQAIVETAHARGTLVVAHISRSDHLRIALETGVDDVTHMIIDPLPDDLIGRMVQAGVYWEPTLELWRCASNLHSTDLDRRAIENLRRFAQAGGLVALGTDYAGYRCQFDLGLPATELDLMRQAGMAPMQIIVAATRNAARVCNLGAELGTLETGKIADILVVDGNPLEHLEDLARVRLVMHNGVIIRQ